jgi:hypothetical protein
VHREKAFQVETWSETPAGRSSITAPTELDRQISVVCAPLHANMRSKKNPPACCASQLPAPAALPIGGARARARTHRVTLRRLGYRVPSVRGAPSSGDVQLGRQPSEQLHKTESVPMRAGPSRPLSALAGSFRPPVRGPRPSLSCTQRLALWSHRSRACGLLRVLHACTRTYLRRRTSALERPPLRRTAVWLCVAKY